MAKPVSRLAHGLAQQRITSFFKPRRRPRVREGPKSEVDLNELLGGQHPTSAACILCSHVCVLQPAAMLLSTRCDRSFLPYPTPPRHILNRPFPSQAACAEGVREPPPVAWP